MASGATPGRRNLSHLCLKRFADGDPALQPGAVRARAKLPWDALAERDPSGRAACKHCGSKITKGQTRLVLLLQCHKGYKVPCTLHFGCFWNHPETHKLESHEEIHLAPSVDAVEAARIRRAFDQHRRHTLEGAAKAPSAKRRKKAAAASSSAPAWRLDHVALLCDSIESSLASLAALLPEEAASCFAPGKIESFPSEGTRECYVGKNKNGGARLLLMEAVGSSGPYARALAKRCGWVQHSYCRTSVPKGTAWLYCKGIPTLLEATQACRHTSNAQHVAVDVPVGSVVAAVVPVLSTGLISAVEVCSFPAHSTDAAVAALVGGAAAERQWTGLLPLADGAVESSGDRSAPSPRVRLRLPGGILDVSIEDVCSPGCQKSK